MDITPNQSLTPVIDVKALTDLFDLTGKTAFVPGGYGALGEVICWALGAYGARIVVAGPKGEKAERLAKDLHAGGYEAVGMQLDATSVDEIRDVAEAVKRNLGPIDILVNCVGVQREQALMNVTVDVFDEMYETNLKSAMFLGQVVAGQQIQRGGGGRQIHLLSVRSTLALRDRGYSAYCATKGGLLMLVKQHAMELAPHQITVNGVAPTFIRSERIRPHLEHEAFRNFILERNPLGRIGDPIEVAGPILMLASAAGSYITGETIYVDGGVTASQ